MKNKLTIFLLVIFGVLPSLAKAQVSAADSDGDGLTDAQETNIYHTNPQNPDTDNDGFLDGDEIKYNYDPNKNSEDKLQKKIFIALADQSLSYRLGDYIVGSIKISSGLPATPTPTGSFEIESKKPLVDYIGADYNFKNTRWNMLFKKHSPLNYYIHGAFWHNNFGQPMSHGCINVSYKDIEPLYNWADVGTQVIIQ
ncbi:MAG: L,D-transpeptidase [Candidatus Doudnabacteria bacterium]|nr:L,D-transpeptidase [Candidatus Doudnabacteria bacterium]